LLGPRRPPRASRSPYTTLFRSETAVEIARSFGSEILVSGIDPQRDADVLASYRVDLVRHAANPAGTAGADPVRPLKNDVLRLNRSEEHTSELQSRENLVCRLLL